MKFEEELEKTKQYIFYFFEQGEFVHSAEGDFIKECSRGISFDTVLCYNKKTGTSSLVCSYKNRNLRHLG